MYRLSDHLGNVRATINRDNNGLDPTILSYSDYYAWGMPMPGREYSSTPKFRLGYQSQEYENKVGMYGFSLRMYDQRLGRWFSTDPYGQHWSPYLAMSNNPISFVDPDGGSDWWDRNGVTFFVDGMQMESYYAMGYLNSGGFESISYDGRFGSGPLSAGNFYDSKTGATSPFISMVSVWSVEKRNEQRDQVCSLCGNQTKRGTIETKLFEFDAFVNGNSLDDIYMWIGGVLTKVSDYGGKDFRLDLDEGRNVIGGRMSAMVATRYTNDLKGIPTGQLTIAQRIVADHLDVRHNDVTANYKFADVMLKWVENTADISEGVMTGGTSTITKSIAAKAGKEYIKQAVKEGGDFAEGSFSVFNWKDYPAGGEKPTGPFRLLEGTEYSTARNLANKTNAAIHKANPQLKGLQIHEINPVKLGGNPTDMANKTFLTPSQHSQYTNFWNSLIRSIK